MSTKPENPTEKQLADAADKQVDAAKKVTPPASEVKAPKTVNVRILRTHPDLAYTNGEEVEVPTALYDKYNGDENSGPFFEKI